MIIPDHRLDFLRLNCMDVIPSFNEPKLRRNGEAYYEGRSLLLQSKLCWRRKTSPSCPEFDALSFGILNLFYRNFEPGRTVARLD